MSASEFPRVERELSGNVLHKNVAGKGSFQKELIKREGKGSKLQNTCKILVATFGKLSYSKTFNLAVSEVSQVGRNTIRSSTNAMNACTTETFRKLLTEFPCLIPCDGNLTAFAGFIQIIGREYRVRITNDCSSFEADDELLSILRPATSTLSNRLQAAESAHDFLLEVRDIVERLCEPDEQKNGTNANANSRTLPPACYYERLLSQIAIIGWQSVSALDERLQTIDLTIADAAEREHSIHIKLGSEYPSTAPICSTSLPEEFHLDWTKERTLASIKVQFQNAVNIFQDFFRVMEDFDKNACVLEPERPTWREASRRLALGKHTSLRVRIDARAPVKTYAECHFLGSEQAISPLRKTLNENMHLWDTSGNVLPRQNLETILKMTFPRRQEMTDTETGGDIAGECGICYAYRLQDSVPDIVCDLEECGKPYHRVCLVEWLRALPDTKESFGTLSGNCVYCEEAIAVAVKAK